MDFLRQIRLLQRRTFLGQSIRGVGSLALTSLFSPALFAAGKDESPKLDHWKGVVTTPHVKPRAKRVIWLCMAGGMSHLETFDPKPRLAEMHGQPMPESYTKGQPIAQLQNAKLNCFAPQHPFKKFGKS